MAKLFFRYSAMNAGKSTSLLQIAYNYEEQGQHVRLFTAHVDDRYGIGKITSRLGAQRDAEVFRNDTDFQELEKTGYFQNIQCVLIDEAQFLMPHQVEQLHQIANTNGIPIICFGIRSDFQGKPFPGAAALLTLADDLEELKTICTCGRKASMNMRVNASGKKITHGNQIDIGGNSKYKSTCPRCFYDTSL